MPGELIPDPTFPIWRIREVWHTGTLDPADKRKGSYEGAGLSVSRHPDAWESIARGRLQGVRHRLICPTGCFLDAHRMRRRHRQAIQAWALAEGYVEARPIYRFSEYDDELERRVQSEFTTREEAVREADGKRVRAVAGLIARPTFSARSLTDWPIVDISRDLAALYAEDVLDLDGVWWDDTLDEVCLTAPCGVIAPSRVRRWTVVADAASDLEAYDCAA